MIDHEAPSWNGLLGKLVGDLGPRQKSLFNNLTDFLEKAEYYDKVKPRTITKRLEEILDKHPRNIDLLEPHRLLLKNFDRIYTTNYDKFFEDVAGTMGIDVQNVPTVPLSSSQPHNYILRNSSSNRMPCTSTPSHPCTRHNNTRRLIKYHGDYRVYDSLVLTETSYFKRLLDVDAKDILFAGDALFYDFLFLGYSFQDMSLKYTIQQLERTFETLGNAITGKRGRRETKFFILRTDNALRNKYQDKAYALRSLDMAKHVAPNFNESGCHLKSFAGTKKGKRLVKCTSTDLFFSSYSSVWAGAEHSVCSCTAPDCTKLHSIGTVPLDLAQKAGQFRAQILNYGFTEFLKELVK